MALCGLCEVLFDVDNGNQVWGSHGPSTWAACISLPLRRCMPARHAIQAIPCPAPANTGGALLAARCLLGGGAGGHCFHSLPSERPHVACLLLGCTVAWRVPSGAAPLLYCPPAADVSCVASAVPCLGINSNCTCLFKQDSMSMELSSRSAVRDSCYAFRLRRRCPPPGAPSHPFLYG